MIIGAKKDHAIQLFDYLNKPDYDVTIEHIGKIIITIEKKDVPIIFNDKKVKHICFYRSEISIRI